MNERILELAEQCEGRTICDCGETGFNFEKFAELIVEECRTVMTEVYRKTPLELCGPFLTADEEIAKHFYGVEELPACKHDWYSAKNPVVQNGSVCVICGAIDPREPEELKNE
jgi:hypothetical protein